MNNMQQGLQKALQSLPISSSTSKPEPKYCQYCRKEKECKLMDVPLLGKRWTLIACQCELDQMELFKEEQKRKKRRERINKLLKLSSVNEDLKKMTFGNFSLAQGSEKALREVKDAVINFNKRQKLGLMLFGATGNGKTHLTAAGANQLIEQGYAVIFLTEKDLFSRLNETKRFTSNESFMEIMNACLDADLLVWDDFMSSQKLSNEEKDWVFQIVNGRERANKPIWATSNLTPKEFHSKETPYFLDDKGRSWWRLIGNMNCIWNTAENYRALMAMKRIGGDQRERV